jgi:hypothetical protein
MSRSVSVPIENAITGGAAYRVHSKLKVEPSRMYFNSLTSGSPPGFADVVGLLDEPIAQDIVLSPNTDKLITFYQDGGLLKYQVEGVGTVVTVTSGSASGKPGLYGGYIFFVNGSNQLVRYALDFTQIDVYGVAILSGSPDVLASVPADSIVHGVSETACVVFVSSEGGIKVTLYMEEGESWSAYSQDRRFMFPLAHDYTSGSPSEERSFYSLGIFSGAAMLNGNAYAYLSNALTGGIEGIRWDSDSKVWSDIFVAVTSDLKASICEFRISNCYVVGDIVYMAGQFQRNENVDEELAYTMILRSTDGKVFSLDKFSLVSDLNYRFLGAFYEDKLYISSCNRICKSTATWIFGGDTLYIEIPSARLGSISDADLSRIEIDLGDAGEEYMDHAYMIVGSKITLQLAYETTGVLAYLDYGTYFIDALRKGIREGARLFSIQAINMALWQLQGMSSPFYTEIISKSSVRDDLDSAETTQLYVAEFSGINENQFSVDLWESEPYEDTGLGITGIDIHEKGGVDIVTMTGVHKKGIKTRDLKEELGCEEYPEFTSGSANFQVYGWSYVLSGNDNDDIQLVLFLEDEDGVLSTYASGISKWPCTYQGTASGNYPLVFVVEKPIGTKIRQMGLVFSNSSSTKSYPCRIDCVSGTNTFYRTVDSNTGWYSADDEEWKIRGKARPCIMFSRKPYDTFNFQIEGEFEDTLTGWQSGYGPVAYGLVGLAENARNYVVARYNKTNGLLELVKARSGVETTLTSGSPSVSADDGCQMMFIHKDGYFDIRLKDGLGVWVSQLTYSWLEADSWMFISDIAAKHTGIYGYVNVPYFRIVGLDEGSDPDIDKAIGIPVLPGANAFASFPSSGNVDIGDRVYSYTSKINHSEIRGPFQYRQHGKYPPPYGNDHYGIEVRDMDWSKSDGAYTGYLLAVDDGLVYKITGSKWEVFNSNAGVRNYLPGRARYYATESILKIAYHTLSNRVYVTGGLDGSSLLRGEATIESWGEMCYLHTEGHFKLLGFRGSSGDIDATVEDIVEHIARSSGADIAFPGDYTSGSSSLVAETPFQVSSIPYTDGFDVRFTIPVLTSTNWIAVDTNATLDEMFPGSTGLRVELARESAQVYLLTLQESSGSNADQFRFALGDVPHHLRVLFHDQFVTAYIDDIWVYTFHMDSILYPVDTTISLVSSENAIFSDIRVPELCDWREAIYIDLETDGMAAIGSVVQERPVEIYAVYDGSLKIWYDPTRSTITQQIYPRSHDWVETLPKKAASDAIVYFSDVQTILNNDYRDSFGFATKVYRMPNLDRGAIRAAYLLLKGYYRERLIHSLSLRPDIRVEMGDKLSVSYVATGTGTTKSFVLTVDSMSLMIQPSNSVMNINGREV